MEVACSGPIVSRFGTAIPAQVSVPTIVCVCVCMCVCVCARARALMHACPQSCPTLCDPMDCNPLAPLSMEFPRQEYWNGLPLPPPGDFPNPEVSTLSPVSP